MVKDGWERSYAVRCLGRGRRKEGESGTDVGALLVCAVCVTSSVRTARMGKRMRIAGVLCTVGQRRHTQPLAALEAHLPRCPSSWRGPCAESAENPKLLTLLRQLLASLAGWLSALEGLSHLNIVNITNTPITPPSQPARCRFSLLISPGTPHDTLFIAQHPRHFDTRSRILSPRLDPYPSPVSTPINTCVQPVTHRR